MWAEGIFVQSIRDGEGDGILEVGAIGSTY